MESGETGERRREERGEEERGEREGGGGEGTVVVGKYGEGRGRVLLKTAVLWLSQLSF